MLVHLAHQGWVPEVEQPRPCHPAHIHVGGAESIVSAGRVQKGAVDARRADHDGVGGRLVLVDDHPGSQARVVCAQEVQHSLAEQVRPDLTHQPGRDAQPVQRQPGIGHRPAG